MNIIGYRYFIHKWLGALSRLRGGSEPALKAPTNLTGYFTES